MRCVPAEVRRGRRLLELRIRIRITDWFSRLPAEVHAVELLGRLPCESDGFRLREPVL